MKKLMLLVACAVMITACDNFKTKQQRLQEQNDSLRTELNKSNSELNEFMDTYNQIQEGFRLINEAEGRVNATREGGLSSAEQIKSDMTFIAEKLKQNRERIAQLQKELNRSKSNSSQMKKAMENLTAELVEKTQQLETLRSELESKNIRIAELDDALNGLRSDVESLTAINEAKEKVLDAQDKALNTAWFVYGTKSELKEQKILQKGEVLQSGDFNKDYFTQIDIRKEKEIPLYAKSAKLLTTHPEGSYLLEKDEKKQYVLRITNPTDFWSVSRYLVIQVRP